jgi:hypothetical protein
MVSSVADLEFVNDTGGTIYIEAGIHHANPNKYGRALVKIYGNKSAVKYKPRVSVSEKELRDDEIDPARTATTWLDSIRGDRVVHSKLIRKSSYKSKKVDKPEQA